MDSAQSLQRVSETEALRREIERLRIVAAGDRGLLETLLQHSPHGVIVCDAKGKLVLHNRAAERIWAGSASVDSVSGWGEYRAFHPDGRPYEAEDWAMARCLSKGEVVAAEEVRIQRFDGTFGTILGSCAPIYHADGTLQGALSVFADITKLTEATERLHLLQETTAALSKARTVREVGQVVVGKGHEALRASASVAYQLEQNELVLLASRGLSDEARLERRSIDEQLPLMDAIREARPIFLSQADGSIAAVPLLEGTTAIGVIGFSFAERRTFDTEERELILALCQQCAQALERARLFDAERKAHADTVLLFRLTEEANRATEPEHVFEPALDAVLFGLDVDRASILLFDPDGVLRFKAWRGLSEEYRAAVEGGAPWSRKTVDPRPIFVEDYLKDPELSAYRPIFEKEGIRALGFVPLIHQRKLLGKFMVYAPTPRVFSEREIQLMQTIATQVAQTLARAEAIRQVRDADRRKDEFLAMLAHELRNPLSPIVNAVEILRLKGPDDPMLTRAREIIRRQAQHMSRMIDDLLDVSRISQGKLLLKKERIDLAHVVRTACDDHADDLSRARVTLILDVPEDPIWTVGDETRLAQVIGNLLGNAAKFTDPGGTVHVSATVSGEKATITVKDTGIGMTPEVLQRIFEPFSQDERTLARARGGLGLGLALVKGMVDLHGGSVSAASEGPGKGSELSITLPLRDDAGSVTASQSESSIAPLSVLIVEDNADAAETLATLLDVLGHTVVTAHDGASALQRAREVPLDLILCDIGLPGELDGYQLARIFRSEATFDHTLLVALTGYGQEEDRRRAKRAGFDVHLTKPVGPRALEETIARARKSRRRADEPSERGER